MATWVITIERTVVERRDVDVTGDVDYLGALEAAERLGDAHPAAIAGRAEVDSDSRTLGTFGPRTYVGTSWEALDKTGARAAAARVALSERVAAARLDRALDEAGL